MALDLQSPVARISLHRRQMTGPAKLLAQPLVLLHGWGTDSRVFEPLVSRLNAVADIVLVDLPGFACDHADPNRGLEQLLQELRQKLPERCVLLGWSLGGMVASRYASRYPERVSGLITLACNACFVARRGWASAMPSTVFRQFYDSFEQRPAAAIKRFDGLQVQGDRRDRSVLKWLRRYRRDTPDQIDSRWLGALGLLAAIDNRGPFAALTQPGLHLLGEADALVSAGAAPALAKLNPGQAVDVLEGAGHALPLSVPDAIAARVKTFLQRLSPDVHDGAPGNDKYHLDKSKVADSFSRAAATYDAAAELQRQVGAQLMRQLQSNDLLQTAADSVLLDVGCGTGYFTRALARQTPAARVVGLDFARGMLDVARRRDCGRTHWVGGDAQCLPLADNSVEGIFSSLAIQWCEQLTPLMRELRRVLKPGGWLAIATLGPDTLHELRRAWSEVDDYTHVNRFAPRREIAQALHQARFDDAQWQCETRVMHYGEVRELTRELKALGAHNVNAGKSAGLTGRRRLRRFVAAYEQFRCGRKLPASYEVYYVVAR